MGHINGAGADECKFGYALAETGRKMDIEKMGTMGGGEVGGWDATTLHCHHPITRTRDLRTICRRLEKLANRLCAARGNFHTATAYN